MSDQETKVPALAPAPWATKAPEAAPEAIPTAPEVPAQEVAPVAEVAVPSAESTPVETVVEEVKAIVAEAVVMVTVTVPKMFKLRLDTHAETIVQAGIQEMSLELAEHWFSKANGVTIYTPASKE